jgi:hypothetical protein
MGARSQRPSPPKGVAGAREPRGAQRWILAELRELKPGAQLSTARIAKRIRQSTGKTYHKNSVYLALRLLVHRGDLHVTRVGNQKLYRIATPARSASRMSQGSGGSPPELSASVPPPHATPVHHKLGVGEILVFHIGDWELHSATNYRGRLVLKKHHLPK